MHAKGVAIHLSTTQDDIFLGNLFTTEGVLIVSTGRDKFDLFDISFRKGLVA